MSETPAWALGYELPLLKELAAVFKQEFKPHTYGAFGLPKERDIAAALAEDGCAYTKERDAIALFKVLRSGSMHTDFSGSQVAKLQKGDLFIRAIAGPREKKIQLINSLAQRSGAPAVWVEAHAEIRDTMSALFLDLGFRLALTKISASSDIKALCHWGNDQGRLPTPHLAQPQVWGLRRLHSEIISPEEQAVILRELHAYEASQPWAQHYSSYNKRQSWTAFALKGYDVADPGFIIKPSEMSKQWKAENAQRLSAACAWTAAAEHFIRTTTWLRDKIPCRFQRVRLMRLSARGGELTRHADITDPEAGVQDGQVARLHIPLVTSPGCEFRSWGLDGREERMHLHERGLFYLDTRKPHAVQNNSASERIHLVVDAFANDWLRECLRG